MPGRRSRGEGWNAEDTAALRTRIVELREARGWTQREAARELDLSPSFLSQMESGARPLTLLWIRRMARVYRVFPAELFAMLGVEEFDWLATLQSPGSGPSPIERVTDEEWQEVISYLTFLRLRSGGAVGNLIQG